MGSGADTQWLNNPLGWAGGLNSGQWSSMLGNNSYGGIPGAGGPTPSAPYQPISQSGIPSNFSTMIQGLQGAPGTGLNPVPQSAMQSFDSPMGVNAGIYGNLGSSPMNPFTTPTQASQQPFPNPMGNMSNNPFTAGLNPSMNADVLYALQHPAPNLVNQGLMDKGTKSVPSPLEKGAGKAKPKKAAPEPGPAPAAHRAEPAQSAAQNPGWTVVGGKPVYVDLNTGNPMAAPKTSNKQQKAIVKSVGGNMANLSAQAQAALKGQISGSPVWNPPSNKFNAAILKGVS